MRKITQAQYDEEEKQRQLAELQLRKGIAKYQQDNKLEFFKPPPKGWVPDVNKTAWYHNPHQAKLFKAWMNPVYKIFALTGGNRTGKTHTAVAVVISCLHGYWIWDEFKTPINQVPFKVMMIGQKWEDHIAKTLIPKLKDLWPKRYSVKTKKNNQGVEHEWILPNGSVLHIMSNRQEVDSYEGGDYDLIVPDEPCKEDIWDAATRGLIDRGGKALITATLLKEPWMDRNIIKARLDDGRPDPTVFSVYAKMTDNIGYGITQENVDEYKHRYRNKPELLKARVEGIPSYMAGLVWNLIRNQPSGEGHLKDRFKRGIPIDWMIDIGIDVHPKEPQAALFLATSPKGYKYVVEEIFENMSAKQLAQEIVKLVRLKNYRVNKIIIDPFAKADENSPDGSMFTIIDNEFAKFGLGPIYPGSKDQKSGIDLVKGWLMTENEEPALFFFNDLVRTIWEIEGWMWKPETGKPVDKDDHMCENLRRLIQLDTVWEEPEEEEDEDIPQKRSTANPITGY
jgi:hypothetical protein